MTNGWQEIVSSVVALVGVQRRDAIVGFGSVVGADSATSIGCEALLQPPSWQTRRVMVAGPIEPYRVENEPSVPLGGEPPGVDHQCESTAPDTSGEQETSSSGPTAAGPQLSEVIVGAPPPPPQAASNSTAAAVSASAGVARFRNEISSRKAVYGILSSQGAGMPHWLSDHNVTFAVTLTLTIGRASCLRQTRSLCLELCRIS